ncbi:MAG: DUF1501 domain-containing protein [Marinibacterium sp.]|nr:DUF1501 domain-containing protein [Marinibacterium sp.]
MSNLLTRRRFLAQSAVIGCSAAASPLLTPVSFASAPWDTRLVVILLRGGMDGLDVVQPYGDPAFAAARSTLPVGPARGAIDLDGFFAMHGALAPLEPLWRAGDLGFVQAASTPYRDKRSHFDGQDLLEAGTMSLDGARDGWLNRLLGLQPGVTAETAYALGRAQMKMMIGDAPHSVWAPDTGFDMSPQALRLAELVMRDDPQLADALAEAARLSEEEARLDEADGDAGRRGDHLAVADFAADQLRGEARVASFSIGGWDTHARQQVEMGRALGRLSATILALQSGVGADVWQKTAVVVVTEFGRTLRENGTRGTDHGTGGAMMLAGGAVAGGRVYGAWPGLDEADLFDRRDLMPTSDVRGHLGWILRGMTGLGQSDIETTVFPGLDMGRDPGLLL